MFEYAISLEYMPPQSFYASAMYDTAKDHVHITATIVQRIERTVRGHHVYKAVWSPYIGEKSCHFNMRAITSQRHRCSYPQEQQHCTTGNFQRVCWCFLQLSKRTCIAMQHTEHG